MEDLEGKIKEIIEKYFEYSNFSGDIGATVWSKRDYIGDTGSISNDFCDVVQALTKLVEESRKEIIELLKEAVEGWDTNFGSIRGEFEFPNEEEIWDKEQDRINFIEDYLTKLTDSKVGKESVTFKNGSTVKFGKVKDEDRLTTKDSKVGGGKDE
jgi:hypothetical protein